MFKNMSYKDILGNGPPKLPPDLVESDEEDDEMPDLVTTDTADIPWDHISDIKRQGSPSLQHQDQPPPGDDGHELADGGRIGLEAEVIRGNLHELDVKRRLDDTR